mmetsp:Transcript_28675/g.86070  ORF Transcript_28675/g.86070 Transcript_28675/m.86070 type:complete len:434 (-) Transcript_28675:963-2264(-)
MSANGADNPHASDADPLASVVVGLLSALYPWMKLEHAVRLVAAMTGETNGVAVAPSLASVEAAAASSAAAAPHCDPASLVRAALHNQVARVRQIVQTQCDFLPRSGSVGAESHGHASGHRGYGHHYGSPTHHLPNSGDCGRGVAADGGGGTQHRVATHQMKRLVKFTRLSGTEASTSETDEPVSPISVNGRSGATQRWRPSRAPPTKATSPPTAAAAAAAALPQLKPKPKPPPVAFWVPLGHHRRPPPGAGSAPRKVPGAPQPSQSHGRRFLRSVPMSPDDGGAAGAAAPAPGAPSTPPGSEQAGARAAAVEDRRAPPMGSPSASPSAAGSAQSQSQPSPPERERAADGAPEVPVLDLEWAKSLRTVETPTASTSFGPPDSAAPVSNLGLDGFGRGHAASRDLLTLGGQHLPCGSPSAQTEGWTELNSTKFRA